MYPVENRIALVTGASSGLGFETAAQLAESGFGKVVITARTQPKADDARRRLAERTGTDLFETSVMDFDSLATIDPAIAALVVGGPSFDVLMFNAGIAPPSAAQFTKDGLEATIAGSLIGYHRLTMPLLGGPRTTWVGKGHAVGYEERSGWSRVVWRANGDIGGQDLVIVHGVDQLLLTQGNGDFACNCIQLDLVGPNESCRAIGSDRQHYLCPSVRRLVDNRQNGDRSENRGPWHGHLRCHVTCRGVDLSIALDQGNQRSLRTIKTAEPLISGPGVTGNRFRLNIDVG